LSLLLKPSVVLVPLLYPAGAAPEPLELLHGRQLLKYALGGMRGKKKEYTAAVPAPQAPAKVVTAGTVPPAPKAKVYTAPAPVVQKKHRDIDPQAKEYAAPAPVPEKREKGPGRLLLKYIRVRDPVPQAKVYTTLVPAKVDIKRRTIP
jgi:hypothetical protein